MGFAILRTQKLKSPVAVHRSLKHAMREQDTPNADPTKTPDNTYFGAHTVAGALEQFNARLPAKYRKDAVLCIEYMVTASPAAMAAKSRPQQDAYLTNALGWLQARHGAENVFYAGIHRDETTPHLYAYVVPRDDERLNCRKWLGGSKALSQMQTEFAELVGQKHELERGIERSRARHVSIREFYGRLQEQPVPERVTLAELPEPKLLETKRQYAERAVGQVHTQLVPMWKAMHAKAVQAELASSNTEGLKKAVLEARQSVKSAALEVDVHRKHGQQKVERIQKDLDQVIAAVVRGGAPLEDLRRQLLAELGREVENRNRGTYGRNPDRDEGPEIDR
ncbi:hypothetical protein R69746_08484 [Paraburkholderia aspalathi]|uniref:MobV family relaxase n=1 Tax=Paraburkholderia aspalathi TaxID=1324617 RepID=UPI0019093C23|nr:MobV family relaxase [Paraburkholderia aspalathi]CAE6871797.1 hypothetical protein R69746_08484 [Paraburkholderia aspalathi]